MDCMLTFVQKKANKSWIQKDEKEEQGSPTKKDFRGQQSAGKRKLRKFQRPKKVPKKYVGCKNQKTRTRDKKDCQAI